MLISYKNGQTSVVLRVKLRNSSVTTGAGLAGLTFSSTGLRIAAIADNEATTTAYTVAGSTIETISTLGTFATPTATKCRFKEVDATNHPGLYEIQLDNTRFAVSNAKSLTVSISGAANLAECDILVPLVQQDPYTAKLPVTLASTDVTGNVACDLQTIKTQTVTCGAGVTVLASVGTAATSTAQTGDAYARIGAAGAGLTALGDTRLAYLDAAVTSRLAPTVSGRTLDVTATGEAGIDWSNVGSPTATVALTGTTVALTSAGLDNVVVETGINARQALAPILAATAGTLSGAGTGTITIKSGGGSTTRITATTDSSGNRSAVSLSLPS